MKRAIAIAIPIIAILTFVGVTARLPVQYGQPDVSPPPSGNRTPINFTVSYVGLDQGSLVQGGMVPLRTPVLELVANAFDEQLPRYFELVKTGTQLEMGVTDWTIEGCQSNFRGFPAALYASGRTTCDVGLSASVHFPSDSVCERLRRLQGDYVHVGQFGRLQHECNV